ncbi:hypothetical protein BDW02DRAFT_556077, partial [Decorospora gaudefroyi]
LQNLSYPPNTTFHLPPSTFHLPTPYFKQNLHPPSNPPTQPRSYDPRTRYDGTFSHQRVSQVWCGDKWGCEDLFFLWE